MRRVCRRINAFGEATCTRAGKLRENTTPYDAVYVALAEALEAPIATCDAPLAKAPGHRARIEVIA